jgi:hypothetical protein
VTGLFRRGFNVANPDLSAIGSRAMYFGSDKNLDGIVVSQSVDAGERSYTAPD